MIRRLLPLLLVFAIGTTTSCAPSPGVSLGPPRPIAEGEETATPSSGNGQTTDTRPSADSGSATDATSVPVTDDIVPPPPARQFDTSIGSDAELLTSADLDDVATFSDNRRQRPSDEFLAVSLTDVERFWAEHFPTLYGDEWVPLSGGIFPGFPGNTTRIPGCPGTETSYDELREYAAFYCSDGDFIAYDDGTSGESLLIPMTQDLGPIVLSVVMAHEYAHAVQHRIGAFDRNLSTIVTEQQADCYAGAWMHDAYHGTSPNLRVGDRDIITAMIAMLQVRDPLGTNQQSANGHGSGFDRVGAFQLGFNDGAPACKPLLDDPLPLMPNQFQTASVDALLEGNAPYDCKELADLGVSQAQIDACRPGPVFLLDDLNHYWQTVDPAFAPLAAQPEQRLEDVTCSDRVSVTSAVVLCPNERTLHYVEASIRRDYTTIGDFTLGYYYAIAFAEMALRDAGGPVSGEQRALRRDCEAGAWAGDISPGSGSPRAGDRDGDGENDGILISPGDLDEAVQIAIMTGDLSASANVIGTPFEKVDALREGVLNGRTACAAFD